jgi:hypothetical protein
VTCKFLALFCLCILLCSCDGGIHVKGQVYAQKSSIGTSQVFIDESQTLEKDLVPIKDAKVTLLYGSDYSEKKVERDELQKTSGRTSADGSFTVGALTTPFRFNAGLVVEKDGYKPITKVFYHDKIGHEAIVILVPETPNDTMR